MDLPFYPNPVDIYARLEHLGEPALLDSGDNVERGRYDIVSAKPDESLSLNLSPELSSLELNDALREWLERASIWLERVKPSHPALPFNGGFIGYFSYELGRRLVGLHPDPQARLPLACVHYYPWAVVQDQLLQKSYLVGDPERVGLISKEVTSSLNGDAKPLSSETFSLQDRFRCPWTLQSYSEKFAQVRAFLESGDFYQINLGQPFSAPYSGSLREAYRQLRRVARAPFSALLPQGSGQPLMSLSPERFIAVSRRRIETRPIKGTRPRSEDPYADSAAAAELIHSEKERAENLMIVDLLRNDLGRYCKAGTVEVDQLFQLESYKTVHHLVSVVSGTLRESTRPLEALIGSLPGGSITGAPKRRAMEVIDRLEPASRELWCGSAFYASADGRVDSNIMIRTLYAKEGQLHCWAGGGLVYDSEALMEYREQEDKVGAFLRELEESLAS
ncbi:MAG: anthranilate synthase component I family protein [Pseudomonadota bacterium]